MKPTDFSKYLTDFFIRYLPNERGASINTIYAYRDTFTLYIKYMESNGIKAKKLTISKINKDSIVSFLSWLETERKCSISTINHRLAVLHSFFRYLQYQSPDMLYEYQSIMSIDNKKAPRPIIDYLSIDEMKQLLQQPDISTRKGRRDLAILSLMYDSACRVSELINLTPQNIRFEKPHTITVVGKGNKARVIPILEQQLDVLQVYMLETDLLSDLKRQHPLFSNSWGEKFTRVGVSNILSKYVKMAVKKSIFNVDRKISCHTLRHSKAMHMLQAGINLVYIRDILGHCSIKTTEIYARADSSSKREAIEKAYIKLRQDIEIDAMWHDNEKLLDFLKSF